MIVITGPCQVRASLVTRVFSTGAIVAPDPRQHHRGVPNDLPGQLQAEGRQEAEDPGVAVLGAQDQVEDQPGHHQAETVGVEHVAGRLGGVPFSGGSRVISPRQHNCSVKTILILRVSDCI